MMKKRILFVNLRAQVVERIEPLKVAKQMGLEVILLADQDPKLPGGNDELISELIIANTYNFEESIDAVKKYHEKNPISGVITWGDKDVELVALIGRELDLPTLSEEAAKLARNKYLMRNAMNSVDANLCPRYFDVRTLEDLKKGVEQLEFPLIFKPVGASGSKSIFTIQENTNLDSIYQQMVDSTRATGKNIYSYYPGEYILEEFIEGKEVSVDGVIQDGDIYIAGVTDKDVTEDYYLEYTSYFPSNLPTHFISELKEKATLALKALKLDNCPFHLEARVSDKGVKVLEVAARAGGGFITSHIIPATSGHSLHEKMLKVAVGDPVDWVQFDEISTKFAGITQPYSDVAGKIKNMTGLENVMEMEGVEFVLPIRHVGDKIVLPPEDFDPYTAWIFGTNDNYERLVDTLVSAMDLIKVEVE